MVFFCYFFSSSIFYCCGFLKLGFLCEFFSTLYCSTHVAVNCYYYQNMKSLNKIQTDSDTGINNYTYVKINLQKQDGSRMVKYSLAFTVHLGSYKRDKSYIFCNKVNTKNQILKSNKSAETLHENYYFFLMHSEKYSEKNK